VASAAQIPCLLREIGRLRELSFRAVGEGTGRGLDLDRFDATYLHLFVWNRSNQEVVGAYRLGQTDGILDRRGLGGLYTSTLFRYDEALFEAMGPALEMGRSFVREEYQRSFSGLMLLWQGIGRFVIRQPRYATLFGPVSISASYRSASQQLMAAFLRSNTCHHGWSRWVRPRHPYRVRGRAVDEPLNVAELSTLVGDIEEDSKGVPILLRQYLRLGGRALGLNVDPDFSNVLDVLVLVDLRRTETRVLNRYMGGDGAAEFLAYHQPPTAAGI
jgi:putative hemolysin